MATKQQGNALPLIIGGVVVVALAVVLAITTVDRDERGEGVVSVADLEGNPIVTGDPLSAFGGDTANDPAIGERAPVITGADFEGAETILGDSGNPQLLMFLASWCPACEAELPQVVEWLEAGNLPEGVDLKAVATGLASNRPNWPPDAWFEREGYQGPLVVDSGDGAVAEAYGLSGTPYWVALDADGQVVARISGMIDMQQLSVLAEAVAEG